MEKLSSYSVEIKKIKKCVQRQDGTKDQLIDLYHVANTLGMYDGADYIMSQVHNRYQSENKSIKGNIERISQLQLEMGNITNNIHEYYYPIIEKLKNEKDVIGLQNLLGEIPIDLIKLSIYQSLRELKCT